MPGGFAIGALGFLCFDCMKSAAAAERGAEYFFGGMAAGWRGEGGEWREKGGMEGNEGEKNGIGGKKGLLSPTERTYAPFHFGRRPQTTPGGLGLARIRRLLFQSKPAINKA